MKTLFLSYWSSTHIVPELHAKSSPASVFISSSLFSSKTVEPWLLSFMLSNFRSEIWNYSQWLSDCNEVTRVTPEYQQVSSVHSISQSHSVISLTVRKQLRAETPLRRRRRSGAFCFLSGLHLFSFTFTLQQMKSDCHFGNLSVFNHNFTIYILSCWLWYRHLFKVLTRTFEMSHYQHSALVRGEDSLGCISLLFLWHLTLTEPSCD